MRTTPTAALEGVLHVIIKVEVQAAIYRLMCNHQWKPKSTKYSDTKMSQDMEHHPNNSAYLEGQIKWYRDMHVTSCSKSSIKTSVNGKTGAAQKRKGAQSGMWIVPRSMKALLLECIGGAWKGGIASLLSSTPWYPREKYMLSRHA